MYLDRYQLMVSPFGPEPDADFYFVSERHEEAREQVDQALWRDEAFVAVLGGKGIGKSVLLARLKDECQGELPLITLAERPGSAIEFLASLLARLGFEPIEAAREQYRHILGTYLLHQLRQGSRPVLVIDEAEKLQCSVLEEILWLASVAAGGRRALHCVLFGRQDLADRLLQPTLRALDEEIRVRHELRALSADETLGYISHRLALVGAEEQDLIPEMLVETVHRCTSGIPGKINELCHAALTRAASLDLDRVDAGILQSVIDTLRLSPGIGDSRGPTERTEGVFRREDVAKFVITRGGKLERTFRLDKDRTVIGRHVLNDICIDSNAVSRCHAQVVRAEGVHVLMDLNSTNGTFVNFKRVQQHVLRDNDIVAVGMHRFKFLDRIHASDGQAADATITTQPETVMVDAKALKRNSEHLKRVK